MVENIKKEFKNVYNSNDEIMKTVSKSDLKKLKKILKVVWMTRHRS